MKVEVFTESIRRTQSEFRHIFQDTLSPDGYQREKSMHIIALQPFTDLFLPAEAPIVGFLLGEVACVTAYGQASIFCKRHTRVLVITFDEAAGLSLNEILPRHSPSLYLRAEGRCHRKRIISRWVQGHDTPGHGAWTLLRRQLDSSSTLPEYAEVDLCMVPLP